MAVGAAALSGLSLASAGREALVLVLLCCLLLLTWPSPTPRAALSLSMVTQDTNWLGCPTASAAAHQWKLLFIFWQAVFFGIMFGIKFQFEALAV